MPLDKTKLDTLRLVITENLRIQRGGAKPVDYIDVAGVLTDIKARQNHAVFARRGCGKTLLLHYSAGLVASDIKTVYLNCEDFKNHSFPNVLIEILDALFRELDQHLSGWFGRKRKAKQIIVEIRTALLDLKKKADQRDESVKVTDSSASDQGAGVKVSADSIGGLISRRVRPSSLRSSVAIDVQM